jgi:hypothetical protein
MKKNLKPVDKESNPGLAKLPTEVRNKMGYMKDGGSVGKAKGEDIQVKEVDAMLAQLRNKSKGMSSEALRTLKEKLKRKFGKKDGGMVLEIGLRPATKSEMKMAKKMKKPKKMADGGMARGTGAAIRGKGFKGVF